MEREERQLPDKTTEQTQATETGRTTTESGAAVAAGLQSPRKKLEEEEQSEKSPTRRVNAGSSDR